MQAETSSNGPPAISSQRQTQLNTESISSLREALGQVIANERREWRRERELIEAQARETVAELRAKVIEIERDCKQAVSDRLASLKDGANGRDGANGADGRDGADGNHGRDGIDGKDGISGADGARGVDGQHGKDADPELIERVVAETVDRVLSTWDRPKDGRDGIDGKDGQAGERGADGKDGRDGVDGTAGRDGLDGKDGERGLEGAPGKLPAVRAWEDRVYYEGEAATFGGATYQAGRDTGRAPPHEDWNCIAAAGRDGLDGRSFEILGTYKAEGEYRALNVVALNGGAFVAKRDNPGPVPW
jgi:hypothetical protein